MKYENEIKSPIAISLNSEKLSELCFRLRDLAAEATTHIEDINNTTDVFVQDLTSLRECMWVLQEEVPRLQSDLKEEIEKRREYAAEKDFLYDFLSIIYGHGSLDVASLRGMMQSFDVSLDEIDEYLNECDFDRDSINSFYYAMFEIAYNKAIEEACYSLDVSLNDIEIDDSNYEIFTNCLDSHLSIKVDDDWAEVYDKDELLARVKLLVEQWKSDNQDDE